MSKSSCPHNIWGLKVQLWSELYNKLLISLKTSNKKNDGEEIQTNSIPWDEEKLDMTTVTKITTSQILIITYQYKK